MKSEFENKFKYCPSCGKLLRSEQTPFLRLRCGSCGEVSYLNPKVGVAMIIELSNGIILARRALKPYKNYWTLPAGYVEYEESCEEALIREAKEELGISIEICSLFNVYSYKDDPRSHMVLVVYKCNYVNGILKEGDDVSEVKIFNHQTLPKRIAFSGVRKAIYDYWDHSK